MKIKRILNIISKVRNVILDEFENGLKYEDNSKLHAELQDKIRHIREVNSQKIIMNQYVPEVIKQTLEKDNYLISPAQALPYAVQKFNNDIASGKIDALLFDFVDSEEVKRG